jgi:hypothetical protein
MRRLITFLLVLLTGLTAHAATIEARLVRATNEPVARDEHVRDIEAKLKKQFGYEHYRQLGSGKAALDNKTQRLDLGEGFSVLVTPQGSTNRTQDLHIELYAGKAAVAKMPVTLSPRGHLFAGPIRVGNDWLVLALRVVE